jgi:hypothetical protein
MSGFGKMTIGKPGTKYGLHRPNAAKPAAKPVSSIFGEVDEDEAANSNPGKILLSDKHREKMQKRAEKEMAKALAVDATIFDYDGAHDEIVAERKKEEEQRANKATAQVSRVSTCLSSCTETRAHMCSRREEYFCCMRVDTRHTTGKEASAVRARTAGSDGRAQAGRRSTL